MFVPIWIIGLAFGVAFFASVVFLRVLFMVRRGAETFRAVAEGSSDGLVLMERDSRILWANAAYCQIMGHRLEDLVGRYPLEFALPPHLAVSKEEARAFRFDPAEERFAKLTQVENIRRNGELFMHEFSHAVIRTGKRTRFLLASRDVTERIEKEQALIAAQEKLCLLSCQDSLTGLSNRHCHTQKLAELEGSGEPFAVLQIDMNEFKAINDTHGHMAGDALLVHFAKTITALAEEGWHSARTGGDEFTILMPGVWSLGVALDHANRLFDKVQVPMKWQAGELTPSISVGAAVFDGQGWSAEDVLGHADLALYAAKAKKGVRVAGYDQKMDLAHRAEQSLLLDLSQALSIDAIGFELSPVVDVTEQRLSRFELHPVWEHPQHGRLSHERLHQAIGKIYQTEALESHLIAYARECLARFARNDLGHVGIGISLSGTARILKDSDELAWFSDAGDRLPNAMTMTFPSDFLEDESTLQQISKAFTRLSEAGMRIQLDDPGLSMRGVQELARLDVHGIRLGGELVTGIGSDMAARALVTAWAGLAASLDIAIGCRDVDLVAQVAALKEAGCTEVRGRAVSEPMSLDEALEWANTAAPGRTNEYAPSNAERHA